MNKDLHWNTIPAAQDALSEEMRTNAYTLNHWRLIDLGEGVALEGHIHGRSGFPDGLQISTSFVSCWYQTEDCFYFATSNSAYACSKAEYILESNSLALLEKINADVITEKISEDRKERYLSILKDNLLKAGVFLNWCGCDSPYLKWTAYAAEGQVEFEDSGATFFEASARFMLKEGPQLSIRCSSSSRSGILLPLLATDDCPVFIENSGTRSLTAELGTGKRPLYVQPGGLTAVKITLEPVYSAYRI